MLYNFTKFLGRLFRGLIYVKDQISLYITKHSNYSRVNESSQTNFQKLYNNIKSWFIKSPSVNVNIPLYETHESYLDNIDDNIDDISETHISPQSSRNDTDFEFHLNNMLDESTDFFRRQSYMSSSIYPPSKRPLSSYLKENLYEHSQEQKNIPFTKKHKSDEENILYTPVPVNTTIHVNTPVPVNTSIHVNTPIPQESNVELLSPTPIKPFKKDIFNSDFLVKFLNYKDNIQDYSNNKIEENELKQSLLNNSYDNFNNLNDNLDDNLDDNIV
jgi:hypothetical protein